jgi:hypothetical protein
MNEQVPNEFQKTMSTNQDEKTLLGVPICKDGGEFEPV